MTGRRFMDFTGSNSLIHKVIDFLGVFYEKIRVFYEKTKTSSIFDPKIPYFAPKKA